MTETNPEPAAPHESVFHRAEQAVEHAIDRDPAAAALTTGAQSLLRGHSAALLREAAGILEADWPGGEAVASRVLEIALGVARAAGIAL